MGLIEATKGEWAEYRKAVGAWKALCDRPVGDPERKAAWDAACEAWSVYQRRADCYWQIAHGVKLPGGAQ